MFILTESAGEQNISIILNGEESELKFFTDRRGTKVRNLIYSFFERAAHAIIPCINITWRSSILSTFSGVKYHAILYSLKIKKI